MTEPGRPGNLVPGPTEPPHPARPGSDDAGPGYARYVLGIVFLTSAVSMLDRQILVILIPPIQSEFGVSDTEMGLLTGLGFAAVYSVAGLPVARWADHAVRRSIIALGLLVWSGLTMVTGASTSFFHVFAARMGVGIAQTAAGGPVQSLVSDYFPPERRAGALGLLATGGALGMALALLLGGWVNELFGWRWAFVAAGLPGVGLAAIVRFTVREPIRGAMEVAGSDTASYSSREVWRFLAGLPSFRHLLACTALHAFASMGASAWIPAFLIRAHGLGTGAAGSWLALVAALAFVGTLGGGLLADRLGRRDARWYMWLPGIATLAGIPFAAAFLLSEEVVPEGIAWYAVAALVGGVWTGPSFALVQGLAKVSMRATAAAFVSLTINLIGMGLGPLAVGALSDALAPSYADDGLRYALLLLLAANGWAAVHHFLAARTLRVDLEAKASGSAGAALRT